MAKIIKSQVTTNLSVLLELTEEEVRALDGIFGYDPNVFMRVFYEKMGRAYVEPYENGVRSLHKTIRGLLSGPIAAIDEARKAINKQPLHDKLS